MKPITVTMSAFGSYAEKISIDFTSVQSGLFLITGDTGSGKTTVFDAIVYALYDRTSGGKRDGNMMRSKYAGEETETYVEYCFSYRDEIYTIRRSPEYTRPGLRKMADGSPRLVKVLPKVELILPDKTVFQGKKRETDQKIAELIGVDAEQFTQICMIAQGDFLKLLHAESRERRQIFSRIFQTRIYYQVQEELKQQTTILYIKLEDNIKDIRRETQRAEFDADSEHGRRWKEITAAAFPVMAELTDTLQLILDQGKEQEEQSKQKAGIFQARLEGLTGEIKAAEAVNEILRLYEEECVKRASLKEKEEQFLELKERTKAAQKAEQVERFESKYQEAKRSLDETAARLNQMKQELEICRQSANELEHKEKEKEQLLKVKEPLLMKEIVNLENAMGQYEMLCNVENLCIQLKVRQEEETAALKIMENETLALEKKQEVLAKRCEELADCMVLAEKYAAERDAINVRAAELSALSVNMDELRELSKICSKLEERAKKDTQAYRTASCEYELKYQSFLNEQAGILAKELKDKEPCPVCGSCHHPQVRELPTEAPSQEEVEEAKQNRNRAEKAREESNQKLQEAVGRFWLREGAVKGDYKRIFLQEYSSRKEDAAKAVIQKENDRIQGQQIQTQLRYEEALGQINELQVLKKDQHKTNEKKDKKQNETALQRDKLAHIQTELSGAQAEYHSRKEGLLYDTQAQAAQQLLLVQKELDSNKKALLDARNKYQSEIQRLRQMEGNCESIGQQLNELEELFVKTKRVYKEQLVQEEFTEESYLAIKVLISKVPEMLLQLNDYEQKVRENQSILTSLKGQSAGKEKSDVKELHKAAEEVRRQLEEVKDIQMRQYGKNHKNKEIMNNIKRYFEKQKTVREEYEIIGNLSRTCNGNLSGAVKMDFETYIQRQYFKQIIAAANRRLRMMNSEEFLLQCRDVKDLKTQGQAGLDLDIYHMVSGTVRDIRTLSGGESFMAALSMALGLADIVTNAAGAVHLDTMFVDEGFGSLDDNAREMAMRVLDDLAEGKRLVGIISHVNELKEQIDLKLLVDKTEKGSRAIWSFEQGGAADGKNK